VVVTVVWRDGARVPTKLRVKVHGNTVGELLETVAERTGIRRQNLTVLEVFASKIYATFTDSGYSLSSIKDSDIIVVYEVSVPRPAIPEYNWSTKSSGNEEASVNVQQRVKKDAVGNTQYVDTRPVGTPLQYIETKKTFLVKTLYQFVDQHVERFLSRELLALATVDTPAYTLSISDKENRQRKHVLDRTDTRRVTDFDETHVALEWDTVFWNSYIKNDESRVCCVAQAEMVEPPV
jgi:hypothetical protein